MPTFISDEELSRLSNDASAVADRADACIRELQAELENVKAKADAAALTADQTCSLFEQKFTSLSAQHADLQSQYESLNSSMGQRSAELAEAMAQKQQLHLQSVGKDKEVERLKEENSEMHNSKTHLLEMMDQKHAEISEKNATIRSYLDKILTLTESAAEREARLSEVESQLVRVQASCSRLSQEKELLERHNAWMNQELTSKADSLTELRKLHADTEAEMSAKLADVERKYDGCCSSLNWHKEELRQVQIKLSSVQQELCLCKEAAASNEQSLSAELLTVNKLVELYKQSSEEWSRKAGELDGVIKALETHLSQVESDYNERLEKEVCVRKDLVQEGADLREKLRKCEAEVERSMKADETGLLLVNNLPRELNVDNVLENNQMNVPKIPPGVSGTALAASILRDGWSLAKMYTKYQEAVDALRHEQLGRKESESILQRVLSELEEKAGVIMDERAEYERMVEAYSMINKKLQGSVVEQSNLEKTIQELKADLRRLERENNLSQKEIADLQNQVTILLKECRDVQLQHGSVGIDSYEDLTISATIERSFKSDIETVISENLVTFKDIKGLVEQNVQLRTLVRKLSDQIESKEIAFKGKLEIEVKRQMEDAAIKVSAVLQRIEEQDHMIESLHSSVAMYKKLYEEQHKHHSSLSPSVQLAADTGDKDFLQLLEGSQEAYKKAQEKASERVGYLEEELAKTRNEMISLRSERENLALKADFAKGELDCIMKEAEHQRNEMNAVLARNVEFSQLIVEYQRKLRESSESVNAAEELSRKLTAEVSRLKCEKEVISNAEKRACDEVKNLSERVLRLQATLDTVQGTEEIREEARAAERRKQEEHIRRVEQEWAEAKKQLQDERDNARSLAYDREQTLKNATKQVEEMRKELANACAAAEARATFSEAKLSDMEKKIHSTDLKELDVDGTANEFMELQKLQDEVQKLRAESQANKDHMLQYKNIAQVNEEALKQMETAHEMFKMEAEKLKESLEGEIASLRKRVSELEAETCKKSEEVASAAAGKEEALASAFAEITSLKDENSSKTSQIVMLEVQKSTLNEELVRQQEKCRAVQANYERQVILQSETIQELTKTSQALRALQEEASELRKLTDAFKSENAELKAKWEAEKSVLEKTSNDGRKKYDELNEQNKILHNRLDAFHIKMAERDRNVSGDASRSANSDELGDSGLQSVISYLRRSKDIAEMEISLLKQEKLRLQSQLESALMAAKEAEGSLQSERSKSRTVLMTGEELKSLQLQVREVSLLRESNIQLREENKYNFEECQKLREVAEKARNEHEALVGQLKEREIELEARSREIKQICSEKKLLEQRVSELLKKYGSINLDECERLKSRDQELTEIVKEKDRQIEETMEILSRKQDALRLLEQDVGKLRIEISERENKLNESSKLEADLEKQKRLTNHIKSKVDRLSREKDQISKENEALRKQLEELKQGISKENEALRKQLEELKQVSNAGKGIGSDTSGDQVMKEKEEKDTRIQMLERTVERLRDEIQTLKAKHLRNEKEQTQVSNELDRHQLAMKRLSEELENLKQAEISLPEVLSGTILDDRTASYISAAQDFERVVLCVLGELSNGASSGEVLPGVDTPAIVSTVADQPPVTTSTASASREKEGRLNLTKTSVETRKTARKLIRPRLARSEEQQTDIEMPEPSRDVQVAESSEQQVRKRLASTTFETRDDLPSVEAISNIAVQDSKRARAADSTTEVGEAHAAGPADTLGAPPVATESSDAGDMTQGPSDEVADPVKEVEPSDDKMEESRETEGESGNGIELDKKDLTEEISGQPSEVETLADDETRNLVDQGSPLPALEGEKEEGELPEEQTDTGAAEILSTIASPEGEELQPEQVTITRVDEDALTTTETEADSNLPDTLTDEKIDEGDVLDEIVAEASDKSNDANDQITSVDQPEAAATGVETATVTASMELNVGQPTSSSATPEREDSKQRSPGEREDLKQRSPGSTPHVVNIQQRARERARDRMGAVAGVPERGRGRPVARGRFTRGRGRSRGPNPSS